MSMQDADPTLLERIQDICHFLITFHTPISFSTPHVYISTQPFLPSQSPLSRMFSSEFTRAINIRVGRLSSWPAPPLEWTGHTGFIQSVCYSPDGTRVVSGSYDKKIRIWDAESGTVIGEPLTGHTAGVNSVAYSPDGRHIISGSSDSTIRIWDAETGTAVGSPLVGHAGPVCSVAYSPDRQRIASGSSDKTNRVWDPFLYVPFPPSSSDPVHPDFCAKPDMAGWVRDSQGGLLYWVPHDIRTSLHSPALLTIPLTSRIRSGSLDFDDFAFGTSWTQIFESASS